MTLAEPGISGGTNHISVITDREVTGIDPGKRVYIGTVRTHLLELRAAGLGTRQIALRSAVDRRTIYRILDGSVKRISLDTRDRLLAVWPSELGKVPAEPVWSQLNALRAAGWTDGQLAKVIHGYSSGLHVGKVWVTSQTAEKVAELYQAQFPTKRDVSADPLEMFRHLADSETRAWRRDAECARIPLGDPRNHPFFPGRGVDPLPALRVCAACAVWASCLEFAVEHNEVGTWGRSTGSDRREIKNRGLTINQIASAMPVGGSVATALRAIEVMP